MSSPTVPLDPHRSAPRDFAAEMDLAIEKAVAAQTPYVAPLVAQQLVDSLRQFDPDLLRGWLQAQAVELISEEIGRRDRRARMFARRNQGRTEFRTALDAHGAGDPAALTGWLGVAFVVNDQLERLPLGRCKAAHLRYVAEKYGEAERRASFDRIFFETLAQRVGNREVGEVFTDVQIHTMYSGLAG